MLMRDGTGQAMAAGASAAQRGGIPTEAAVPANGGLVVVVLARLALAVFVLAVRGIVALAALVFGYLDFHRRRPLEFLALDAAERQWITRVRRPQTRMPKPSPWARRSCMIRAYGAKQRPIQTMLQRNKDVRARLGWIRLNHLRNADVARHNTGTDTVGCPANVDA